MVRYVIPDRLVVVLFFLESAAIWESCRGVLYRNAVRHVPLFSGKRPSPHACPRMRAGKGRAASKQTRQASSTTTLSANKQAPLEASSRRRHMAASARMNL